MTSENYRQLLNAERDSLEMTKEDFDNTLMHFAMLYHKEQLALSGVGSSTFKVAISDSHCTYDFKMKLPKTTCIRDISKRLYASFGLKEEQGELRK